MNIRASCMECTKTYTTNFLKRDAFCSEECEKKFYAAHPSLKDFKIKRRTE